MILRRRLGFRSKLAPSPVLICVFIISAVLGGPKIGHAQASAPTMPRMQIGFGGVTDEREIINWISKYDVSPEAVLLWTHGLSSTHRTMRKTSWQDFMAEARREHIEIITASLERLPFRFQRFLDGYTENQVMESPDLQAQARSLLGIRAKLESALEDARAGKAMIYAVEVSGSGSTFDTMRRDRNRRALTFVAKERTAKAPTNGVVPEQYRGEYMDPMIRMLPPKDLWSLMRRATETTETLRRIHQGN